MTGSLAGPQIDAYERDGFLFPLDAMTADEAHAWRHRLERTETDYAAGHHVNPNARQVDGSKEHALLVRGVDRQRNFIHFVPPRHAFGTSELALHEEIMRSKTSANF